MKYKDLNIGDWFEVDGHKYIKCDYDDKHTAGVILDNETIGTIRVFFDDEIDSIRQFNIGTQLSIDKLDAVEILPFGGVAEKQKKCCFIDR